MGTSQSPALLTGLVLLPGDGDLLDFEDVVLGKSSELIVGLFVGTSLPVFDLNFERGDAPALPAAANFPAHNQTQQSLTNPLMSFIFCIIMLLIPNTKLSLISNSDRSCSN